MQRCCDLVETAALALRRFVTHYRTGRDELRTCRQRLLHWRWSGQLEVARRRVGRDKTRTRSFTNWPTGQPLAKSAYPAYVANVRRLERLLDELDDRIDEREEFLKYEMAVAAALLEACWRLRRAKEQRGSRDCDCCWGSWNQEIWNNPYIFPRAMTPST
ncbi:hypothetical protein ABW21_db0200407 [Orbilia brochopaga]|nr:hypothetical protein ABW21_db0200407 [Drechslerella brochopaga]